MPCCLQWQSWTSGLLTSILNALGTAVFTMCSFLYKQPAALNKAYLTCTRTAARPYRLTFYVISVYHRATGLLSSQSTTYLPQRIHYICQRRQSRPVKEKRNKVKDCACAPFLTININLSLAMTWNWLVNRHFSYEWLCARLVTQQQDARTRLFSTCLAAAQRWLSSQKRTQHNTQWPSVCNAKDTAHATKEYK